MNAMCRWYLYSHGLLERTRFIFDIHSLSSLSCAKQKDQLDPMALLVRPLFTIAIIISAGWNAAGHSKYVLSVNHVDVRERVKPMKILEEMRA